MSPLAGIKEGSAIPMGAIIFITSLIGTVVLFTLGEKTPSHRKEKGL